MVSSNKYPMTSVIQTLPLINSRDLGLKFLISIAEKSGLVPTMPRYTGPRITERIREVETLSTWKIV